MKNKYLRSTYILPVILSSFPVLFFGFLFVMLIITIFEIPPLGNVPGFGQEMGGLLILGGIFAPPLGLLLFMSALTLSVAHLYRFPDETKAYRRRPLKITLLIWVPTLYILLRHALYMFLNLIML